MAHWISDLHPRDIKGMFTEKVKGLSAANEESTHLPDGTTVHAVNIGGKRQYKVTPNGTKNRLDRTTYPTAEAATQAALDMSAQKTDPKSLGGTKSHKDFAKLRQSQRKAERKSKASSSGSSKAKGNSSSSKDLPKAGAGDSYEEAARKKIAAKGHKPVKAGATQDGESVYHPGHNITVTRDGSAGILPRFKTAQGTKFTTHPDMPMGRKSESSSAKKSGYTPKGRTDESSYDYTDDPKSLKLKFGEKKLRQALLDDLGPYVTLKFDYEENVPRAAVVEAIGYDPAKSGHSKSATGGEAVGAILGAAAKKSNTASGINPKTGKVKRRPRPSNRPSGANKPVKEGPTRSKTQPIPEGHSPVTTGLTDRGVGAPIHAGRLKRGNEISIKGKKGLYMVTQADYKKGVKVVPAGEVIDPSSGKMKSRRGGGTNAGQWIKLGDIKSVKTSKARRRRGKF